MWINILLLHTRNVGTQPLTVVVQGFPHNVFGWSTHIKFIHMSKFFYYGKMLYFFMEELWNIVYIGLSLCDAGIS